MRRPRVSLTGAAGNWGRKVLDEFRDRADRFDVVVLVLPNPKDLTVIRQYEDRANLEVIFGDLTDYSAVERCVHGADYVLHIGAVVSPLADEHPELAMRANVGSIRNIVAAVKAQPGDRNRRIISASLQWTCGEGHSFVGSPSCPARRSLVPGLCPHALRVQESGRTQQIAGPDRARRPGCPGAERMSQDHQAASNALVVVDQSVSGRRRPISVRYYTSSLPDSEATILIWLHGGAFAYDGLDQAESDASARAMAAACRRIVAV